MESKAECVEMILQASLVNGSKREAVKNNCLSEGYFSLFLVDMAGHLLGFFAGFLLLLKCVLRVLRAQTKCFMMSSCLFT